MLPPRHRRRPPPIPKGIYQRRVQRSTPSRETAKEDGKRAGDGKWDGAKIPLFYCFAAEELDFILNYDIKYRLGQEGEDGGEE